MKKTLLAVSLVLGTLGFAQTYCTPTTSLGCNDGDQIDSFTIPSINFNHANTGCSNNSYGDYSNMTISLGRGASHPFTITHGYSDQNVRIWVDFNNDGVFDDQGDELVSAANSIGYETNGTITIPGTIAFGNYRMRVGDRFDTPPIPCNTAGYGEFHDYTLNVVAGPTCVAPSNLTTTNLTAYTATLNWTASTSTPANGYQYYYSTSNTAPSSTATAAGSVGAGITTVNLTNLSPATTYYVWVRSICSGTDSSAWSIVSNFTTACANIVPTYTTNFDTFLPSCWTTGGGGTIASGPTDPYSDWYQEYFLNNGPNNAATINLYYYNSVSWLITTPFDLSGGSYQLKFDYGVTDYYNTNSSAMGSDDVVQLLVSTNGGTSWSVLHTWNASNSPSNTSTTFIQDLSAYTGNNVKFAFYASDGTVNDQEDYNFYITNFKIEPLVLSTTETNSSKANIKAYPNPFTDYVNLSNFESVQGIQITDASGKLVKSIDKVTATINLHGLSSGLYYINVITKDGNKETIKVIKK